MNFCLKGIFLLRIMLLAAADDSSNRDKKHFSLFSVVTFKNEECTSETTFSGGQLQGTCYTSTECSDKAGTQSGNCASGFGVCCIFISATGVSATISENRTYLQNPLYPSLETSGSGTTITYTVNKCQSDICQVRLDFVNFVVAGPTLSSESGGSTTGYTNCNDQLIATTSSSFQVPTLCGVMTGEHIYLDLGVVSSDTASIALTLGATTAITAANAMRTWRIKTSQIPCYATYRAPAGCHRYLTEGAGKIASPNFAYGPTTTSSSAVPVTSINSGQDLMGQDLRTCIRREKGMCCTSFRVCSQFDGIDLVGVGAGGTAALGLLSVEVSQGWSFHVDLGILTGTAANTILGSDVGLIDVWCTGDYVEIPDSNVGSRDYGSNLGQSNSRYCGTRMGNVGFAISAGTGVQAHAPVWDCTEPFEVNYHTNIFSDENLATISAVASNFPVNGVAPITRGLCLDYTQQAC